MTTNDELEDAADLLHHTAADLAHLLRGIALNHPTPPVLMDPGAGNEYDDEWYSPYGTPDFAYGKALKIARTTLAAAQTRKEIWAALVDAKTKIGTALAEAKTKKEAESGQVSGD